MQKYIRKYIQNLIIDVINLKMIELIDNLFMILK